VVVLLGIAAALALAVGFVLQQHEAAQSPGRLLSPRLLLDLVHRPIWVAGIAAMVTGQVLGAVALGHGSLVVVEPLLATNVLFALPLGAWWSRRRPGAAEFGGALVLVAGIGLFLVGGSPSEAIPHLQVSPPNWIFSLCCVLAVVLLLLAAARQRSPRGEATLLATAAGLCFGVQDVLTQRSLLLLDTGLPTLLGSWQPYLLVVTAITGLTLSQSAFELAPLSASLPALTVTEPICGMGLGVALLGEHLRSGGPQLLTEAAGLALMLAGILWVSSRDLVLNPHGRRRPHAGLIP
jgi:drug/metabolite transporter (DMT)-like permease